MAGLSTVYSIGQMQMTDYQNRQAQQSQQNGTNNTTTQEPIKDHTPDPNGTASAPNDTIGGGVGHDNIHRGGGVGDDVISHGGSGDDVIYGGSGDDVIYGGSGSDNIHLSGMSTIFSIGQMQMVDYQNSQEISQNMSENAPRMDMNDYLEMKDSMPTEGAGGMTSVYAIGQMQMVDYQNAQSLYHMADSGLLDEGAIQDMLDSGEFEGTMYAQVAEQILNGDTEGLASWNFQDARDHQRPEVPSGSTGGGMGMSTIFSIGQMQMVDYQYAQDLDKMARNGLIDIDALQERYDEGTLSPMSIHVAEHILNGDEE